MLSKKFKDKINDFCYKKVIKGVNTNKDLDSYLEHIELPEEHLDEAYGHYLACYFEHRKIEDKTFDKYCAYWQDSEKEDNHKKDIFKKIFSEVKDKETLISLLDIVYEKGSKEESDSTNPDL